MRVVSLCPSTTETIADLGRADALVGVTRFCIHPKEVVREVVKVGGTKTPNRERIASLAPDLIFMNSEENREEDHAWLSARFPVDVSRPVGPVDVPPLIRRWGQLLGRVESADAMAEAMERKLASVHRERARPFLYLIWRDPWMAAGRDTYVDALLSLGGGANVVAGAAYPEVELEAFSQIEDLRVLLPDEPFPFKRAHVDELTPCFPRGRVVQVEGDDCCWHGSRTLRGLDLVSSLFEA